MEAFYELISDKAGFAYAIVKYAKTTTTLYTIDAIQMYSAESFNDLVYQLQESGHKFVCIDKQEFEEAKKDLGYTEDRRLSRKLSAVMKVN